ncbi:MAG: galE 4, partial [Nocardioidaceae bacterium]|nr:galE 4 [Nocardioidaceae bacterium]
MATIRTMTWLVTGGAGYIGSHVVKAFVDADIDVVALDSLATGRAGFLPADVPLVVGSVLDGPLVASTLEEHEISGVVHLAAYKYAGESVRRPLHAYSENISGTITLLQQMEAVGVDRIVFSSSAATFGTPTTDLVTERTPVDPESPYGRSKLVGEWIIADQARASDLLHTSMRYFHVVGSGDPKIYDVSPYNLFPLV